VLSLSKSLNMTVISNMTAVLEMTVLRTIVYEKHKGLDGSGIVYLKKVMAVIMARIFSMDFDPL